MYFVAKDLTKKAVEMLLKGATLLSEPCPYCKGVRVMHDGHALCVSCGKEPEQKQPTKEEPPKSTNPAVESLEKKLELLSKELEGEADHAKQQDILKSINSLIETIEKIKNKQ